jgi:hypothetical protein
MTGIKVQTDDTYFVRIMGIVDAFYFTLTTCSNASKNIKNKMLHCHAKLAHPPASGCCTFAEREFQLNFLLRRDVTHPER